MIINPPRISAEKESPLVQRAIEYERVVNAAETNVSDVHGLEARGSQRAGERPGKILVDQEAEHLSGGSTSSPET